MKYALVLGIFLLAGCAHKRDSNLKEENRAIASDQAAVERPRVPGSCKIELNVKASCSVNYFAFKPKSWQQQDWNIDKPVARYDYNASSWEDCFAAAVYVNSDRESGRDVVDHRNLEQTFNILENGSRTDVCGKTFLERLGMGDNKEIKSSKYSYGHEYFEDLPSYVKWKYSVPGLNAKGVIDRKASINNPTPGDLTK